MTTLRRTFALLTLLAAGLCNAQTTPAEPVLTEAEREAILSLPWQEFDQTQYSGWRKFLNPERKEYMVAATLIEAYVERHKDLPPRQRALCYYHAAHQYIYRAVNTGVGDPLEAIPNLDKSIVPADEPPPSLDWNDMVLATKAFLQNDRATLLAIKARVAAMPPESVKFLRSPASPEETLANLGKPYGSWFPKPAPKK